MKFSNRKIYTHKIKQGKNMFKNIINEKKILSK